jgi:hypothetical protein
VKFYRATPPNTIPAGHNAEGGAGPTAGGLVVAVRLADLVSPPGPVAAEAGRTALVVAGTPQIRADEQLVFLKVIAAAPAVVRRDGKVQAGGHPADHARLGALEQQLDDLCCARRLTGYAGCLLSKAGAGDHAGSRARFAAWQCFADRTACWCSLTDGSRLYSSSRPAATNARR